MDCGCIYIYTSKSPLVIPTQDFIGHITNIVDLISRWQVNIYIQNVNNNMMLLGQPRAKLSPEIFSRHS